MPEKTSAPLVVRTLNGFGRVLTKIGFAPVSLEPEGLIAEARKRTGREELGDGFSMEGLNRVRDSLEEEAALTLLGRIMSRESLIQLISNKLAVEGWLADNRPSPETMEVKEPVFIVGLPRSGTTHLHGLLSADPRFRSPLSWEVQDMREPPGPATPDDDPRILATEKTFSRVESLAPGLRTAHALYPKAPQECLSITSQAMMGEQLISQLPVPSYQRWLLRQDHHAVYAYHKRALGFLQAGGAAADHWLLKSPVHADRLEPLFAAYPDARIIYTHRDPAKVIPSLASLMSMVHAISTDDYDKAFWGRFTTEWIETILSRGLEQRRRMDDGSGRFVDISMDELVADPIGTVEGIYGRFGWEMDDEGRKRLESYAASHRRHRHGVHRYDPADFALEAGEIYERFAFYLEEFDVRREAA